MVFTNDGNAITGNAVGVDKEVNIVVHSRSHHSLLWPKTTTECSDLLTVCCDQRPQQTVDTVVARVRCYGAYEEVTHMSNT